MLQVGERSWFLPGKTNIGYYEEDGKGYLIDSGLDDEAGRKILKTLRESRPTRLAAIINTHAHADHIGGNSFIQKRMDCPVWMTDAESLLARRPALEPTYLWSAHPFQQIRGRFTEAKPSNAEPIAPGKIRDTSLEASLLPGHGLEMIGVRTPDGVFFAADSVFDSGVIDKYRFIFVTDVKAALATLDSLEQDAARLFIPSHSEPTGNIRPLAQANRNALLAVNDLILAKCSEPRSREEILASLAGDFGLEMRPEQYLLNLSAVSAHLTYLNGLGEAEPFIESGRLLWRRTGA